MTIRAPSTMADRSDILDFANLVFSMAHRPHDFAVILPKVYGTNAPMYRPEHQFIARKDGRVVGLVALHVIPMRILGNSFKMGIIGTVSTHPYHRGGGDMKALMGMAIDAAKAEGCAYLELGGQRQRYGYFGFTPADIKTTHDINGSNVRHALADVDASGISFADVVSADDPILDTLYNIYDSQIVSGSRSRDNFLCVCNSWTKKLCAVKRGDIVIGYAIYNDKGISELILNDPSADAKPFYKAWHAAHGNFESDICLHQTALMREAADFCEDMRICHDAMVNVLDWATTLQASLALKCETIGMPDGSWTIQIDDDAPLTIVVINNKPSVKRNDRAVDTRLSHMKAQSVIFSTDALVMPERGAPAGWFPLPMGLFQVDSF